MMLSKEYRKSSERRFCALCKAVFHHEARDYYREKKRGAQREISLEYLYENTPFAPFLL